MSSANRGAVRQDRDLYRTPPWCVNALVSELDLPALAGREIIDAGCGDGRIGATILTTAIKQGVTPPSSVLGVDLNPEPAPAGLNHQMGFLRENFLDPGFWKFRQGKVDLVVSNPPFRWAEEFLTVAQTISPNVAFLLPLTFLGSGRRVPMWRRNPPIRVLVLTPRPSFTADGRTDSNEYAWVGFTRPGARSFWQGQPHNVRDMFRWKRRGDHEFV